MQARRCRCGLFDGAKFFRRAVFSKRKEGRGYCSFLLLVAALVVMVVVVLTVSVSVPMSVPVPVPVLAMMLPMMFGSDPRCHPR